MKVVTFFKLVAFAGMTFILGCRDAGDKPDSALSQATVYYGGDILTMEGDTPRYVEALVVRDGKIEFAGASDEAMEVAGRGHKMVDLSGKTMLPGFIDGHAHFGNFGLQAIGAQLLAPPDAAATPLRTVKRSE